MSNFRISAKKFLLTYPQCPLEKEVLLEKLQSIKPVKQYVICKEQHQDGSPHLHAAVEYSEKLWSTLVDIFDCEGYHPNIQSARSWQNCVNYVKKGNDYIESLVSDDTKNWASILNTAASREHFLAMAREHFPRDYALNLERLEYTASKLFPEIEVYSPVFTSFNLPPGLTNWAGNAATTPSHARFRGLFLIGVTRTGKSEWARSLGEHSYFQSMFSLEGWRGGFAIFDDIPWEFVPAKKCFFGGQRNPFYVTDKYRKKTRIRLEKPSIYVCNPDENPFSKMSSEEESYFRANNAICLVHAPLY